MRKIRSLITSLLFVVGLLNVAWAAAEPKWISLFDGKTLNGWKAIQGKAKIKEGKTYALPKK